MVVIIEGMEMPKNCAECDFRRSDMFSSRVFCSKALGEDIIVDDNKKLDNCPLVEIVTCKDCRYGYGDKYYGCSKFNFAGQLGHFYCASGKRRE